MRKTYRISQSLLEQYNLGCVSDRERKLIEKTMSTDIVLRLRYEALKKADQEIRRLYPIESMPALAAIKNTEVSIPINEVKQIRPFRVSPFRDWSPRRKLLLAVAAVFLCVLIPALFYLRGRNPANKIEQISVIPNNTEENHAPGFGQGSSERTIPDNTAFIKDGEFSNKQLTSVTIPDHITLIGSNAFSHNLLSSISIPGNVETIGDWAFSYNQLTSISIPNGVILIGEGAFANNRLTSVTIPGSVAVIGDKAFADNQLTSVTIEANVLTDGAIPGNFTNAYNINNNAAGTYTRPNASSDIWTKQ